MQPLEPEYNELAQFSPSIARELQSGCLVCYVSSRCRSRIDSRYIGLRAATGELVAKKTLQPDERGETLLDLLTVRNIILLPYDTLPIDMTDLISELNSLSLYPHRLLIRYKGAGFVPNWLLLLHSDNMDHWQHGLISYTKTIKNLSNESLIDMFLWREFYRLASVGNTYSQFYSEATLQPEELDPAWNLFISNKEMRDWLAGNMNAVFKPTRLSKLLDDYLPNYRNSIGSFELFSRLLQLCLWSSQEDSFENFRKALDDHFMVHFPRVKHFTSKVTASDLEKFLWTCQGELPDSVVKLQESSGIPVDTDGSMVFSSFLDMLFCKSNSITDETKTTHVYHNMDKPLSAYYISTSHNTYLSGDQLRSESSVQCYVSALRQGCRCVELDLWDGPKDTPVIYHGHTLTTKIDLEPVLLAIREHAFACSDYPLILSLEDHCNLQQQDRTADLLISIFGQSLLTAPLTPAQGVHHQELPSPSQLRFRVLIKHSKLKSRLDISTPNNPAVIAAVAAATSAASSSTAGAAMADAPPIHTGQVQVQNPVSNIWEPYVAVLTENTILFISDDSAVSLSPTSLARAPEDDLTSLPTLIWFHPNLSRTEAECRIRRQCYGDSEGRFLVRPSPTNPGNFALSFMNHGVIHHCQINKTPDPNNASRWLFSIPNVRSPDGSNEVPTFARMTDLVDYFRANGIDGRRYFLTKPVPQDLGTFPWYLGDITKKSAEELLRQVPFSGAYLVRKKSGDCVDGEFVLTFRAEREIKRCLISCRNGKSMMGNFPEFDSLPRLINHFVEQPIYRNIRLRYPTNQESVQKISTTGVRSVETRVVCENDYHSLIRMDTGADEALLDDNQDVTMRAIDSYSAQGADELSFSQGDILVGVTPIAPDWLMGTLESTGIRGLVPARLLEPCNTGEYVEMSISVRGIYRVYIPQPDKDDQNFCRLCIEFHSLSGDAVSGNHQLVMQAPSENDLVEWIKQIEAQLRKYKCFDRAIGESGSMRRERISQRLSDLVVYCVPIRAQDQRIRFMRSKFYEMVSVSETRLPKNLNCQLARNIRDFTLNQLVRVYPKTTRFKSSNFNPLPAWELGCQMVALNWQTSDRAMLLNRALFADNGGCGYVLKPEFYKEQLEEEQKQQLARNATVELRVIAGRRLPRTSPRITSSYVEAELCNTCCRSSVVADNGLNPVYRDCYLNVGDCPENSILRIAVYMETESWQDRMVIGQFARPIRLLRSGYRSVALCDLFGDEIPACSLLVHLVIYR